MFILKKMNVALNDEGTAFIKKTCFKNDTLKHKCLDKSMLYEQLLNDHFFEKLSKMERARTAAATATQEFLQSIQAPSSTHPGISYLVRANPSLLKTG